MIDSPASTLRRAAEKLRGLAQAAIDAGWSGKTRIEHSAHGNVPILVSADSAHVRGIADVMTDAYAELLATLGNPTMGLLIADQWDVIADDMDRDEAVETTKGGVGVLVAGRLFQPRKLWTVALATARSLLGEEAAS